MKITAIATITQGFCTCKTNFLQSAVSHVINITKQAAQLRAAIFNAGGMPETFGNCNIIVIFAATLRIFLQICRTHNFEKYLAVDGIKSLLS